MAKSIMQDTKECYLCRKWFNIRTLHTLELHHIFPGTANKKLSDRLGLTVWLCHRHHNEPPLGVHYNLVSMNWLQDQARLIYDELQGCEGALDAQMSMYYRG